VEYIDSVATATCVLNTIPNDFSENLALNIRKLYVMF